ncbi:DNA-binding protein [Paenibacillus sabinae]|uniref:Helix-turn-helix domain-containing protein n=1 Tax=Paenibacillus sabinae T27 TaxID=1268072 RepID=X4ZF83_9BACL|nr:DNA-binding protein [Paenibacillus sabinae]AHV96117.1 hypothetical protein PSAB_05905 [Paenibacillus sabinae T27]
MKKHYTIEELPPVLTAQHIADYLLIARLTVYGLFDLPPERGGIRNFPVGKSRRAMKSDLIDWINSQRDQQYEVAKRRMNHIEGVRSIS